MVKLMVMSLMTSIHMMKRMINLQTVKMKTLVTKKDRCVVDAHAQNLHLALVITAAPAMMSSKKLIVHSMKFA